MSKNMPEDDVFVTSTAYAPSWVFILSVALIVSGLAFAFASSIGVIGPRQQAEAATPTRISDDGVLLFRDSATGCEYFVTGTGGSAGITPRLTQDGKPRCK